MLAAMGTSIAGERIR